jgi:hypothetical protein
MLERLGLMVSCDLFGVRVVDGRGSPWHQILPCKVELIYGQWHRRADWEAGTVIAYTGKWSGRYYAKAKLLFKENAA